MTQTCHPITQAVAHDMLRGLIEAICDRPAQTKAQRESRSTEVVHSVLAFEPRDPVEMMLAGMVVTHFHLISHAAHEAFGEQPEALRPRTRSGIVALDRAMVGFVKELRTAKTRPMEGAEEVARSDAPAAQAARATPERQVAASPAAAVATANTGASWRDAAPEPLLPPLPRGAASDVAMMAVVSPPVTPVAGNGARKQAAVSGARLGPDAHAVPEVGTDAKEERLARLAKMMEAPPSTAGIFRVAGTGGAKSSVAGAK